MKINPSKQHQQGLPVLVWFAFTAFRKAFNGCKRIAWANLTGLWQSVGHVGKIVVLSNGAKLTVTCCGIVKSAWVAAQNFSSSAKIGI